MLHKFLALMMAFFTLCTPALADTLTIPHSFTAGTPAQASQVNANFSAVSTWSTNITNDNIKAAAGIVLSKIDKTSEYLGLRSTGTKVLGAGITGDTIARACFTSDGYLQFGPGSASATDIELRRITGPILRVNNPAASANLPIQALSFQASVLGDANPMVQADTTNGLTMGAGGASARDMALRRKSSSYFQITDLAGTTNKNLEVAQVDATTNGDTQPKVSVSTSGVDLGVGGSTAPALRLKYEDANTISVRNGTTDNAYKSLKALDGTFTGAVGITGNTTVGGTLGVTGTTTLGAATATSLTVNGNAVLSGTLSTGACGGYLTLESGVAGSTSDQTAKSTLYFTPDYSSHTPGYIDLYNGSSNVRCTFTEISASVTSLTTDKNVDVFVYDNNADNVADTLDLVEWTDDTTRATALATQANIGLVKTGATGRRWVGTIRTYDSGGTKAIDSLAMGYVNNAYNKKPRPLECKTTTDSYTYTTATVREAEGGSTLGTSRIGFIVPLAGNGITAENVSIASNATGNVSMLTGIGLDSSTTTSAYNGFLNTPNGGGPPTSVLVDVYKGYPAVGFHTLRRLEYSTASGTTTWYGDSGGTTVQTGMRAIQWR